MQNRASSCIPPEGKPEKSKLHRPLPTSSLAAAQLFHTPFSFAYTFAHMLKLLSRSDPEYDQYIEQQMSAQDYSQWLEASKALDRLLGLDRWQAHNASPLYDHELVAHWYHELREARLSGNTQKLLYLVRTRLSRNLGNIGDPELYKKCYAGTKNLISDYISECELAIEALLDSPNLDDTQLVQTLLQTRKAYGRTALVLSGGATLGLLHAGVIYELHEHNLLPKIVSGSSAGSIFAAMVCVTKEDEFDRLWDLQNHEIAIFNNVGIQETMWQHVQRFLTEGTWVDGVWLETMTKEFIGEYTFLEAYNRTGRILNVTVSSSGVHDMPRLLNYLTAPNVLIWSAVCASCSLPLVFSSNTLMAKNPRTGEIFPWVKTTFIDGSVDNDLPLARLAEMFDVNHFIACQVNPHIAPMLHLSQRFSPQLPKKKIDGKAPVEENDKVPQSSLWARTKSFVVGEVAHALQVMKQAGVLEKATSSLLNVMAQEYIGNITVLPSIELTDFANLLRNPTPAVLSAAMQRGRTATWPKLSIARNHCAIELKLDEAIIRVHSRMISKNAGSFKAGLSHARRSNSEDVVPTRSHRSRYSLGTIRNLSATTTPSGMTRRQSSVQIRSMYSPLSQSPVMSRTPSATNLYALRQSLTAPNSFVSSAASSPNNRKPRSYSTAVVDAPDKILNGL